MYSSILLAVDLDAPDSWVRALPVSLALARTFKARLTICSVVTNAEALLEAEWSPIAFRQLIEVAEARLNGLTEEDVAVRTEVTSGAVWSGIIEAAERAGADLIVLASHKPEMKDYLLGANASRVVRRAACSVLVVRGEPARSDQTMADRG